MAEKIEFRLITPAGQSMKVKIPAATTIAKLKEKLVPTLTKLAPDETWDPTRYSLTLDGGGSSVSDTATAQSIEGRSVTARPRDAASPPPALPATDQHLRPPQASTAAKRKQQQPPPPKQPAPPPAPPAAATPTASAESAAESSSAAAAAPPATEEQQGPPPSQQQPQQQRRVVVTVHFVGPLASAHHQNPSNPGHMSHINFRLNPAKVTFAKLRALVHENTAYGGNHQGARLLFRRSDGRPLDVLEHTTLAAAGIATDVNLDCTEDPRTPDLLGGGGGGGGTQFSAASSSVRANAAGGGGGSGSGVVHVVLESTGGQRLPVALSTAATVASVAKTVDDEWGIPAHSVGVVWLGRALAPADTVRDCGIVDGASLQIVARGGRLPTAAGGGGGGACPVCGGAQAASPYCPVTGRAHRGYHAEERTALLRLRSRVDGKEYRFPDIRVTATVYKVKTLIEEATGVPVGQQVVAVRGREIPDGFSLKDGGLLPGGGGGEDGDGGGVDVEDLPVLYLRQGAANFPFKSPPAHFWAPPAPPQVHHHHHHGGGSPGGGGSGINTSVFGGSGGGGGGGDGGGGGSQRRLLSSFNVAEKQIAQHAAEAESPYRACNRRLHTGEAALTASPRLGGGGEGGWDGRAVPERAVAFDELERRSLARMEAARLDDARHRQSRGIVCSTTTTDNSKT